MSQGAVTLIRSLEDSLAHARTILSLVGFNTYRRFRAWPADYALVGAAIVIVLALVVWAFVG